MSHSRLRGNDEKNIFIVKVLVGDIDEGNAAA
jgi:hypothetical protein